MGTDCRFIAENLNNITRKDIENDFRNEVFPRSKWRTNIEGSTFFIIFFFGNEKYEGFCNGLIVLGDVCRRFSERDYQERVLEYLRKKCGGRVGVFGDTPRDVSDVIEEISNNPGKAWPRLQLEDEKYYEKE